MQVWKPFSDVDLHCHTDASDGSLNVYELHSYCRAAQLHAVAVTDHDTLSGWSSLGCKLTKFRKPLLIPGVELSTNAPGLSVSVHLVGLWIRPDGSVSEKLTWLQRERRNRNQRIIRNLEKLGVPLEKKQVKTIMESEISGRAHIALAMVEQGHVDSVGEAFSRYLYPGRPAYSQRERLEIGEAIRLIRQDGGISVLCHTHVLHLSLDDLRTFLFELKSEGLDAVEVYYGDYSEEFTRQMEILAKEAELLASGGSDFHGIVKPGIGPGVGRGSLTVKKDLYDTMLARVEERRSATSL